MAASTRAITPTHSGPFSAPNAPNTPRDHSSAAFGAHLTKSPRGLSPSRSPQLTGAAALAEDRRMRDQDRRTSPNPAVAVVQSLLGQHSQHGQSPVNRPKEGAAPHPSQMSAPMEKAARSIVIPPSDNNMSGVDNMQTSPVSLSSFCSADSVPAATATATQPPTAPMNLSGVPVQETTNHQHPPHHQHIAPNPDNPGSRAFTFPGPLNPEQHAPQAPTRQMSLPGTGGIKSPQNKRHKCPYCSTDFTRHHNLKSHLLTHSQEKPYECPTCQARFRRLHDLKRHTKLHTGERPHTCDKCGRRFARGDALARHNKGQGGCAGRRSSFGIDDDMADAKGEESMDGIIYGEPEGEDDDHDGDRRRVSEPARKRQNTGNSQGPYHQHSSTYPPIAANRAPIGQSIRPLHPPASSGPTREHTTNISPKVAPSSLSSIHYNASQPGVFPQSSMTESPKPISPGQADHHRLSAPDGSHPGARSPSMQTMHLARATGRGSSPMSLPLPHGTSGPHLPTLPGLNPMPIASKGSQGGSKNGPSMLHQQLTGPGSNPGSISSHGASSAGSMREIMGGSGVDVWQYVRDLESRMHKMEEEHKNQIGGLQGEITTLRAQLANQQMSNPAQQQGQ